MQKLKKDPHLQMNLLHLDRYQLLNFLYLPVYLPIALVHLQGGLINGLSR